ncbi:hypothetical protein QWY28_17225 [Nocardioides sp. SOB77]|uniref:Uncharacterized protein n=1 Tax=Nocardioides oceani TaxID=3058369 RepID=A0ABT8FJ56_9ACTN|nr:hypothetical protein [Nocardioides oceani]MDN4174706.1 hypothetical protein [Nocardioides oceani]
MTEQRGEQEPHAYIVEALWNQGSSSEHWRRAMEMDDVREPLSLASARGLLDEMVDDGHSPDALRLVALTVVTRSADCDSCFSADSRCLAFGCTSRQDGQHNRWWCDYGTCSRVHAEDYYGPEAVESDD